MKTYYADIGNTRIKVAERLGDNWKLLDNSTHQEALVFISELISVTNDVKIVAASVRNDILKGLESKFGSQYFSVLDRAAIPEGMLHYDTPETLGMDRFLTARGAYLNANNDAIVIDAGTAITVDYINKDGIYQGGVIMPGVDILKQALKKRLPELPDPPFQLPLNWPGKSTAESMQWGSAGMLAAALNFYIKSYGKNDSIQLELFLTGGDADVIEKLLQPGSAFRVKPFLLFDGMLDLFVNG